MGVPFDMKEPAMLGLAKGKRHVKDYKEVAKAMDQNLTACGTSSPSCHRRLVPQLELTHSDRNGLSYTLWCYEPMNRFSVGDGWNGEDMSLFSYDNTDENDDLLALDPPDLKTLVTLGSRAIRSWCRPYPIKTAGIVTKIAFDHTSGKFELLINVPATQDDPVMASASAGGQAGETYTEIFLPFVHYIQHGSGDVKSSSEKRLVGEPDSRSGMEWVKGQGAGRVDIKVESLSEGRLEVFGQFAKWYYPLDTTKSREIRLVVHPWDGAGWNEKQ